MGISLTTNYNLVKVNIDTRDSFRRMHEQSGTVMSRCGVCWHLLMRLATPHEPATLPRKYNYRLFYYSKASRLIGDPQCTMQGFQHLLARPRIHNTPTKSDISKTKSKFCQNLSPGTFTVLWRSGSVPFTTGTSTCSCWFHALVSTRILIILTKSLFMLLFTLDYSLRCRTASGEFFEVVT
jgi:hypothetical protein